MKNLRRLSLFFIPALAFLFAISWMNHHGRKTRALAQVDDEASQIEKVKELIVDQVQKDFKDTGMAHRDAHAKHHGCVRASFEVTTQNPDFQHGVFAKPQKFQAWIRYSNGSGKSQNDSEGDGRGMAVKLLGIPGEKLLSEERNETTQDFIMINHPVFFVRNAADYVELTQAVSEGGPTKFFFPGVNPFSWRLKELFIAKAIQGKKMANPLDSDYFSMVPYRLGPKVIKFGVRPCAGASKVDSIPEGDPNFLRAAMKKQLQERDACFDFAVQIQKDPNDMPIEDPRVEWSEDDSVYTPVAKITIPRQEFDSEAQMKFCENLSFTPWHALPEHEPLGGINRTRKVVYETVSKLRHQLNGAERREPVMGDTGQSEENTSGNE